MNKSNFFHLVVVLLFFSVSSVLASAPRAIWVWEDETLRILDNSSVRCQAIEFFKERGIGTIYLYADSYKGRNPITLERAKLGATIAEFHGRGLCVYALLGSFDLHTEQYILTQKRTEAVQMFRSVLDYNAQAAVIERYDGVNLDIEPYILDDWHSKRPERACQYLDLCALFVQMRNASESKLIVGPAMPFWFDGIPVSWQGENVALSQHVQKLFDYVSIMDYRDQALGGDGIISHAKDEIVFADRIGRSVVVGVETLKTEPTKLTFHEEGTVIMEQELRIVEEAFKSHPSFGGFAIHHFETYQKLPAHR